MLLLYLKPLYAFAQLGMLNVIEAMQLTTELVYPLYLVAASDRYLDLITYISVFVVLQFSDTSFVVLAKNLFLREERSS